MTTISPRPKGADRHALRASFTIEEIFNLTKIDRWFLVQIKEIVDFEEELADFEEEFAGAARAKTVRVSRFTPSAKTPLESNMASSSGARWHSRARHAKLLELL